MPAEKQHLQSFLGHLEEALSARGYFRPAAKKPKMVDNLSAVLTRPGFSEAEIKVLRGVLASLDYFSPKEPRGAGYPARKEEADAKLHGEGGEPQAAQARARRSRRPARARAMTDDAQPPDGQRPILMFDSGIGGLTVLREARVLMPDRRFVYVADDAAFPYGDWEEEALRARLIALFGELLETYCSRRSR